MSYEEQPIDRLEYYLSEGTVLNSVELLLADVTCDINDLNKELDEDQVTDQLDTVIAEIIVPGILLNFATHYNKISEMFGADDVSSCFQTYCSFNEIADTRLAMAVEELLIEASAKESDNDDDGNQSENSDWDSSDWDHIGPDDANDIDDNDCVFSPEDWEKLTPEERQAKLKKFFLKLAHTGHANREGLPFIKTLNVGDKANYLGVSYGHATQVFNRKKNLYGKPPAPSQYGESFLPLVHDTDHKHHLLTPTLDKHGYSYSHSVTDGDTAYHVWHNPLGHQVSAPSHDTKWSSRVSANAPRAWSGIGVKALDKHLLSRARRNKYKDEFYGSIRHTMQDNEEALPNTKLQEGLHCGYDKVRAYAQWMASNPAPNDYSPNNATKDLIEATKLREKQEKMFGYGKDNPSDWGLLDFRSESGMQDQLLKVKQKQ